MKLSIVLLLLSCLHYRAIAKDNAKAPALSRLLELLPGHINRPELQQICGDPASININNKTREEVWEYKKNKYSITMKWDTKNECLKDFTYTLGSKLSQTRKNRNIATLKIGISNISQALTILGAPSSLHINGDIEKLKYNYANTTVEYQFKDGLLMKLP